MNVVVATIVATAFALSAQVFSPAPSDEFILGTLAPLLLVFGIALLVSGVAAVRGRRRR